MQASKAIAAGVGGALVMTAAMWIFRLLGLPFNLEQTLGSMLTDNVTATTWALGLVMHIVFGAVFGLIYATLFEKVTHKAGMGVGAGIGFIHAVLAGLLLGLLPAVHPLMPATLPAPGLYMSAVGTAGVLAFFGLHLLFGATVGSLYAPVKLENRRLAHTM